MKRIIAISLLCLLATSVSADTKVTLVRTPDHGIQPQAVVDETGTLHLVYFKGDALGGDLFYVRRQADAH